MRRQASSMHLDFQLKANTEIAKVHRVGYSNRVSPVCYNGGKGERKMKAKLSVKEDVVVVNLSGRINMEYTDLFHQACLNEIGNRGNKIIFNLKELSFVGSNGIMPFVDALSALAQKENKQLRFCGVGSEFKKIFAASPLSAVQILENIEGAFASLKNMDFIENEPA